MAMFTLTSGCNNSSSQALSFDKNYLRDASFSSYLNRSEETFVIPNSFVTKSPHEHFYLGRKEVEDGEIGVFGAEKYFYGAINYKYVKDEPVDLGPEKAKTQPGTPSIHSESSWDSQSALLRSVIANPPQKKTGKRHGKGLFASLGCNCSCNGKNSVETDDHVGKFNSKRSVSYGGVQGKTVTKEPIKNCQETFDLALINESQLNPWVMEEMQCKKINREECFSFPILNSNAENPGYKALFQEQKDEKQRKSLEVFGSPSIEKKKKSLTMLKWDTNARVEELEIPAGSEGMYNDIESDASSDLFEIESFTNNGNPFLLRQGSDGNSSCVTPTTCYAPSEASVEWSIVTASAAAEFSAMSDPDQDLTIPATPSKAKKMGPKAKIAASKEMERPRYTIRLGCKSQKSVRVAGEDAYRTNGKAVPEVPVTRFRAENRLTGFDSRTRQRGFDACSYSPAQASHLLFIQ